MIMPETHREKRHPADTAQRKTCQTVQKPDMYKNSFPGPEICESWPRELSASRGLFVAPPFVGISGGCAPMRKPELEQESFWRSRNGASPRRGLPGLLFGRFPFTGAVPDR